MYDTTLLYRGIGRILLLGCDCINTSALGSDLLFQQLDPAMLISGTWSMWSLLPTALPQHIHFLQQWAYCDIVSRRSHGI
jgi:hypothetical protein